MSRKFRFLGYGNRQPVAEDVDYSDMNQDTHYWFTDIRLTVGKIYEAKSISGKFGSVPVDAKFIDDEGDLMTQELQFFEEVTNESPDELDLDGWEWTMSLPEPSLEELAIMNQSALELEAQFAE